MNDPGLRHHHVGIPVSDLERSISWYTEMLGFEEAGIRAGGEGEVISAAVQVEDTDVKACFLKLQDNSCIELIEYERPRGRPFTAANNDVGTLHHAFRVDDIEVAYRSLRDKGIEFNAPPIVLDEAAGDLAGYAFAYFRDPDGIQLEIFQPPPGAPF